MSKEVNTRAGKLTYGNFVRLRGENFWRRVNSDGTLTKVEDGKNGTFDYHHAKNSKVQKQTARRIAAYNQIDPTGNYPNLTKGIQMYMDIRNDEKTKPYIKEFPYKNLGEEIANEAYKKYLGLEYNKKLLKDYDWGDYKTIRLPKELEIEIPVDTNDVKRKISEIKEYINKNGPSDLLNKILEIDDSTLNALRKTYATGDPVGVSEFTYNSRKLFKDGKINYDALDITPLNILKNYNIRWDKNENNMYYSDTWDLNKEHFYYPDLNWLLNGKPFRIRGKVK